MSALYHPAWPERHASQLALRDCVGGELGTILLSVTWDTCFSLDSWDKTFSGSPTNRKQKHWKEIRQTICADLVRSFYLTISGEKPSWLRTWRFVSSYQLVTTTERPEHPSSPSSWAQGQSFKRNHKCDLWRKIGMPKPDGLKTACLCGLVGGGPCSRSKSRQFFNYQDHGV